MCTVRGRGEQVVRGWVWSVEAGEGEKVSAMRTVVTGRVGQEEGGGGGRSPQIQTKTPLVLTQMNG